MNRLHVPASELTGATLVVTGERFKYLHDVLRLRPGEPIEIFDGAGGVHSSRLSRFAEGEAEIALGPREERPFGGVRVTIAQGLPKGDKLELVVQKAVELGASTIVPVACHRSIVKLDAKKAAERVSRWQKIADEAARQSERAEVTRIEPLASFDEFLRREKSPREKRLILDEEERTHRLRDELTDPAASYVLLVGPEGGLSRDEVAAAKLAGFVPVTLGPRILRTETVPLAVLAVIQHVLGDFA